MSAIVTDVLPVFLLIAIGWLAATAGLVKENVGEALGDFVFRLAVPVLLFRTIATADFQGSSPWGLWVAYFGGVLVTWTAGHLVATRLFGLDGRLGVVAGVSSAFANNVFIGLPLVDRVVGPDGMVALSILLSVHLPVMMIAGSLMMQRADRLVTGKPGEGLAAVLRGTGRTLARNPLVIGLLAGSVFHVAAIPLGGVPRIVVDQIAGIAGPAALLSMGMAVRRYKVAEAIGPALAASVLKLLLLPATVFALCRMLGLGPEWTAALVLTSSVPTGVNAWLIASHFGVGHGLASSTITITTAVGALSVSGWAVLIGLTGP